MKFLTILRLIVELLPVVIEMIKKVEELIPGQGEGEKKLNMVRQMLEAVFSSSGSIGVAFEELWVPLKKVIDTWVSLFNSNGLFKK